jgi:homogentisate 1,2-dioxygenase
VRVKRRNALSTITYPYNPLDAVGWHGDLAPVRLNWRDIRPISSHRFHVPPSAHTTFVADRFVVCTFCPRPIESDPGALKVPFFHNNDDYDEVGSRTVRIPKRWRRARSMPAKRPTRSR